jgi:hypothetical protein
MSTRKKTKKTNPEKTEKSNGASAIEFVDEIPGFTRNLKYMPFVEKLQGKVGAPGRLVFGHQHAANAAIRSMKTAANRLGGDFRFATRRGPNDVAVYGVCLKAPK